MGEENQDDRSPETKILSRTTWREAAPTVALLAVVGWIVVAGAVLRVNSTSPVAKAEGSSPHADAEPPVPVAPPAAASTAPARSEALPGPSPLGPDAPRSSEPRVAPSSTRSVASGVGTDAGPLADLLAGDERRLRASGRTHTLQLGAFRDASRLEAFLRDPALKGKLYLIPCRDCGTLRYRLCWGVFGSPAEARAAVSALPERIRRGFRDPRPQALARILP